MKAALDTPGLHHDRAAHSRSGGWAPRRAGSKSRLAARAMCDPRKTPLYAAKEPIPRAYSASLRTRC